MKPKDIFGLAVRLLGLVFLFLGLRAVMPMLDIELIETPDKSYIINGLLPVVFNLAVAWWLLGGGLVRRAYPEPKGAELARLREQPKPAPAGPSQFPAELSGPERTEQKLAALVDKPVDHRVT